MTETWNYKLRVDVEVEADALYSDLLLRCCFFCGRYLMGGCVTIRGRGEVL